MLSAFIAKFDCLTVVLQFPKPSCTVQLSLFLGISAYYLCSVPIYSDTSLLPSWNIIHLRTRPLYALLQSTSSSCRSLPYMCLPSSTCSAPHLRDAMLWTWELAQSCLNSSMGRNTQGHLPQVCPPRLRRSSQWERRQHWSASWHVTDSVCSCTGDISHCTLTTRPSQPRYKPLCLYQSLFLSINLYLYSVCYNQNCF